MNSECPGSPFQSTQPTGNDAVGLEIWCNLDGNFVSIVRDFSSQVGTTYEVTLCDVAIFGPVSSSVVAVPSVPSKQVASQSTVGTTTAEYSVFLNEQSAFVIDFN